MEAEELKQVKAKNLQTHPKTQTNIFSRLFFFWQLRLILLKKITTEKDPYKPLDKYNSKELGDELEQLWLEETFKKNPSLFRVLRKLHGKKIFFWGIIIFLGDISLLILQPLWIQRILDYQTSRRSAESCNEGIFYTLMITVLMFLYTFSYHWAQLELSLIGMKIRAACSSLVYRKALKVKAKLVGQIINLLSNDLDRFETCLQYLHFSWISPIKFVVAIWLMQSMMKWTTTVGILVLLAFCLLQAFMSKKLGVSLKNAAVKTDNRIQWINDVISGINVVKMYTWEKPFINTIETSRKIELNELRKTNHIRVQNNCFKIYIIYLCIFLSIMASVLSGVPITAAYIFLLINIYDNLAGSLTILFQRSIMLSTEGRISLQRVEKFLMEENPVQFTPHFEKNNKMVELQNVSVKWDPLSPIFTLHEVNFKAVSGELVGVMGATGSGKSTLLNVILNELEVIKGICKVGGTVSYASQEPWIFTASVKQNILFGQGYDENKYLKVVKGCSLEHDFSSFPHGDETLVGERGVTLSGGQKTRINLARAVYRDADIYLLDDPLSAVDVHVAEDIVNRCITGYLKDKCVILVTHQLQYLTKANRTYFLKAGKVFEGIELQEINYLNKSNKLSDPIMLKQNKLQFEEKEQDPVKINAYKAYAKFAGGCCFTLFVMLLLIASHSFSLFIDLFLTFWANTIEKATTIKSDIMWLYIYTVIIVGFILLSHASFLYFVYYCQQASKQMHRIMLDKVMYTAWSFFHHHTTGILLNRFTKDMGCIDTLIPSNFISALGLFLSIIMIFPLIVFGNYWMAIPLVIYLSTTIQFIRIFGHTNVNIKKIEAITRSTSFGHLSSSVQGLTTIRAFKVQDIVTDEFDAHQNFQNNAIYLFQTISAAFGFWTNIMTLVFVSVVILSFSVGNSSNTVGNVGIVITKCMVLLKIMPVAMRFYSDFNALTISVERVAEYCELESEMDKGTQIVPKKWPNKGEVSFESVYLKYSSDSAILKDVSFKVKSGEKVGIVGRTGAGKTSLLSVLFRLFDFDGVVTIDGVDTKSLSLKTLRSSIAIIPQEPVLFLGTLRKNIDPLNEYPEIKIWRCLEELELMEMVRSLPQGLDSAVSERGSNFSVGERQLICLARAILRNRKIIVLDEATSNVDFATDQFIQEIVRRKFADCTVLAIAHRLNTIKNSDKILLMENGRIAEYGPPKEILQTKNLIL